MPLVAIALASYAAGLLLGFGGDFALGGAAAAACLAIGIGRLDAAFAAMGGLCMAGLLMAAAHDASQRNCQTRLLAADAWRVTLLGEAGVGAYVRGVARDEDCALPVALSVEKGRAKAGDIVTASGAVAVARRGLLLQRATIISCRKL